MKKRNRLLFGVGVVLGLVFGVGAVEVVVSGKTGRDIQAAIDQVAVRGGILACAFRPLLIPDPRYGLSFRSDSVKSPFARD